jgi:GNAT superfamily N-acetyltransferase
MNSIRPAVVADADAVAGLAEGLATSFPFDRARFDRALARILVSPDAALQVADTDGDITGYVLGFRHPTFYAGDVGSVEEIFVRPELRGTGVGRLLMASFERWATDSGCVLVSLATRRAAAFYRALGYAESAAYFRKDL